MDQELQKITQNLELQKQEWKPSKDGNSELMRAVFGKKIAVCELQAISDALRYSMAVIGIRAANMPNQDEKGFLIEFLRRNFGGHTCEEIKLAFEMAASGRLEVDARHFENFSCEYVGRILTAYRGWAKQNYAPKPTELPELPPKPVDWGEVWDDYKERAKTQDIDKIVIIAPVVDWLEETGQFNNLTEADQVRLYNQSKSELEETAKQNQRPTPEQIKLHARTIAAKNILKKLV